MRPADIAAVARIEQAVFGRDAWPRGAFPYLHGAIATTRPVRGRLWVAATAAGRVLGYAGLEISVLGGEADVVNLAVDPGHRRLGIGRQLLEAVRHDTSRAPHSPRLAAGAGQQPGGPRLLPSLRLPPGGALPGLLRPAARGCRPAGPARPGR
jgi:GNAT superfamily N-acetyltransferase